jgi:crossover junction endodeoxyribonuclease RuvC
MTNRVIVGLDPGTATFGYGVISQQTNRFHPIEFGVIETPAEMLAHLRLSSIFDAITELLVRVGPQAVAVESLYFNVNVRTALAVGQARGVALLACARSGCDLFEYTPQQVKQGVVGYGRADKEQVQEMVRLLLGLAERPRPDDAADALGVAICHANSVGFRSRVTRALSGAAETAG